MAAAPELVHATAIAVAGNAVLFRGPSGAGKSDLALRCLAVGPSPLLPEAARLVSDDQVQLTRSGPDVLASAPTSIRGKLEVRGLGIVDLDTVHSAVVRLLLDLEQPPDRMPDAGGYALLLGVKIPLLRFAPFEPSTPVKVLVALAHAVAAAPPQNSLR